MLNKVLFLMAIFFLSYSCSSIRVNDDGSRYYSHSNIKAFDIKDLNTVFDYKSQEKISFQSVNGTNLGKAVKENSLTWIFVWGDWCRPCIEKLPKMIDIARNNPHLKIVLVAEGYRTGSLQKILFEAEYKGMPYILDSEVYGTNTKQKVKKLNGDLCPTCEFQPAFPQNYIFKEDGTLLLYHGGGIDSSKLVELNLLN